MRHRKSAARSIAGFTMVELVVALGIFAIGMVLTIPAFTKVFGSNQLESGADQLVSHLRLARTRAIAEVEQYLVVWNTSTQAYYLVEDLDRDEVVDGGETMTGPFAPPEGVTLSNPSSNAFPSDYVAFRPSGEAHASGQLLLTNTRGHTMTVSVVQSTGSVEAGS